MRRGLPLHFVQYHLFTRISLYNLQNDLYNIIDG